MIIRPARNLAGSLRLPGDKSISHRYAMLAAIATGCSRLENFASGADCASTLAGVETLGAEVMRDRGKAAVEVEGSGLALKPPSQALDCGNSGSTMRMLAGILAGQEFTTELTGDDSLLQRPMGRILDPLRLMGAQAESLGGGGRPPLRIRGGPLNGIRYPMPVPSAQVKSCILFAGLYGDGETTVEEPARTRDHGELALRAFGAEIEEVERLCWRIRGGAELRPVHFIIPGDLSTAAFFLCAAALFPESNVVFDDLSLNPTRTAILDVLRALGLRLKVLQVQERNGELAGVLQAQGGPLHGITINGHLSAALIDELPVLAAIAPYSSEGIIIRDARELRVKECDRIAAICANLRAMGAKVEEYEDGLSVAGKQRLHGAEVQSFGDHRIAMAFAIAALRAEGESRIQNAEAADISFPEFYGTLEALVQR